MTHLSSKFLFLTVSLGLILSISLLEKGASALDCYICTYLKTDTKEIGFDCRDDPKKSGKIATCTSDYDVCAVYVKKENDVIVELRRICTISCTQSCGESFANGSCYSCCFDKWSPCNGQTDFSAATPLKHHCALSLMVLCVIGVGLTV